jgi:ribosomal protein S27AE
MPYKDPEVARLRTIERLRRLRQTPGYSTRKNSTWNAANPEKRKAHKIVENALLRGDLVKQPCERCSAGNVHAHHDDYSKPLEVRWLCPKDHRARHRELDAA